MAIRWKYKIEQMVSVISILAAIIGLGLFARFMWQMVNGRLDETIRMLVTLL